MDLDFEVSRALVTLACMGITLCLALLVIRAKHDDDN